MRRKAACIAEQYQTVQKLQAAAHVAPPASMKKRFAANNENLQPKSQPPIKKPFLHNFLTRTVAQPAATESPYTRILRARGTPEFKPMPFSKKYWMLWTQAGQPISAFTISELAPHTGKL